MLSRALWKPPYRKELPAFPCSECLVGLLQPIPEAVKDEEIGSSELAHSRDGWEIDWMQGRFTGFYRCANTMCRHVVGVTGTTEYEEAFEELPNGGEELTADTLYHPLAFTDPLPIIRVCEQCPPDVLAELTRSFALYWMDRRACVTAIRSAVEVMLDERGVAKERVSASGKKSRLTLKARLELFNDIEPQLGALLGAIRVIGNVGTHREDVSSDDVLSAYEILEYVIDVAYSGKSAHVSGLVADLLEKHGP